MSASSSFRRGRGRVYDGRSDTTIQGEIEVAGRNTTIVGHIVTDTDSVRPYTARMRGQWS